MPDVPRAWSAASAAAAGNARCRWALGCMAERPHELHRCLQLDLSTCEFRAFRTSVVQMLSHSLHSAVLNTLASVVILAANSSLSLTFAQPFADMALVWFCCAFPHICSHTLHLCDRVHALLVLPFSQHLHVSLQGPREVQSIARRFTARSPDLWTGPQCCVSGEVRAFPLGRSLDVTWLGIST